MGKIKTVLILFSGGYDSTLLVLLAKQMGWNVHCILFDYGQTHIQELQIAETFCMKNKIEFSRIRIDFNVNSKLTQGGAKYEGVSEWHVPSRNLIFISQVASIAEEQGIELIWYGANYEDRISLFPDCSQEWVYRLNKLLEINGSSTVQVEAPLLGMTKETIESFGSEIFNIKKDETFSGYGREEER